MIEIKNITKVYDKNDFPITALENISFNINDGEIVSLLGKSGSGKTTLLNILLGITKPDFGEIIINNEIIINKKTKKMNLKKITNILLCSLQFPDHQLFRKTVKEELLFNSKDENEMKKLLKTFHLDESILNKSPFKLSSGQKRKIILISLLIQKPSIIIFDEATSFLDPVSRREFIDLIKDINKKHRTSILFISHNIEDIRRLSNTSILFEKGKLVGKGPTNKILEKYLKGID